MNDKLTFEEWKKHIGFGVDPKDIQLLKMCHNVDGNAEIEWAIKQEYEFYLKGGNENE